MIDHAHQLIFVHIPKTGGMSIESFFGFQYKYGPVDDPFQSDELLLEETEAHLPARFLRRSFPDVFRSYYKFAFVRNSWDHILSCYMQVKKDYRIGHEFNDWVENDFIGTPRRERNIFITPCQLDWISDDDANILVDYVGRFEAMPPEFSRLCRKLGLRGRKRKLPRVNRSEHGHYSSYYGERARALVAERFERDIRHFGFEFEEERRRYFDFSRRRC